MKIGQSTADFKRLIDVLADIVDTGKQRDQYFCYAAQSAASGGCPEAALLLAGAICDQNTKVNTWKNIEMKIKQPPKQTGEVEEKGEAELEKRTSGKQATIHSDDLSKALEQVQSSLEESVMVKAIQHLADSITNRQEKEEYCRKAGKQAGENGYFEVAKCLIDRIYDHQAKNQSCIEAVGYATGNQMSRAEFFEFISSVIAKIDDVSERDKCRTASAQVASEKGHLEVVKNILRTMESTKAKNECLSRSLDFAACGGDSSEVVKFLLTEMVDSTARDSSSERAAVLAAEKSHHDVVKILLDAISNTDTRNRCALQVALTALSSGHFALLKIIKIQPEWLLSSKVLLSFFASCAIVGGNLSLQQALSRRMEQSELLQLLSSCISLGYIALAEQFVLPEFTDIDHRDSLDSTALMLAAEAGHHGFMLSLLDRRASVTAKDVEGRTALARACQAGQVRAVKTLIDRGADLEHRDKDGRTCEQLAELFGQHQVLRLLHGGRRGYAATSAVRDESLFLSSEEQDNELLSESLHQLLSRAGFTAERAKCQQKLADLLEEIAVVLTQENRRLVGSLADGWSTSLGGADLASSNINWTVLAAGENFHLQAKVAGNGCCCKESGLKKLEVDEGYAQVQALTGNQPGFVSAACGVRPAESTCIAFRCCSDNIGDTIIDQLLPWGRVKDPLHLVSATRPCNSSRELRVSFTFQEKGIMRDLSTCQGQLFILLKIIFDELSARHKGRYGLKSYHIKTLLFNVLSNNKLEADATWQPQNLVKLLNESLDLMLQFLDSDSSQDVCMPHFFLPGAQLYFSNAGIGGDFLQTKSRLRDRLLELRRGSVTELVQKLKSNFQQPLETQKVYFHPFTLLPLVTTQPTATSRDASKFARRYSDLHKCIVQLQSQQCEKETVKTTLGHSDDSERKISETNPWCRRATLCLAAMIELKFGDEEGAKKSLSDLAASPPWRGWEPEDKDISQQSTTSDWAWRFCFPCSSEPSFSFLPEFTQTLLTSRLSQQQYSGHLYVNFRCLSWSLQAELLENQQTSEWFKELEEDPDLEELHTVAHYTSCRDHVQFCLLKMEAIIRDRRLAFGSVDDDRVECVRAKLQQLRTEELTAKSRDWTSLPDQWTKLELEQRCDSKADPSKQLPPMKETLVIISAKKNRSDLVRQLVEKSHLSVAVCDALGRSGLSWASLLGYTRVVEAFRDCLPSKALAQEVNRPDNAKQTPLMLASVGGHEDVVRLLVAMEADVTCEDRVRYTALTHAAKKGFESVVAALLDAGASANHADANGNTPLIWAARTGRLEALKKLSERLHRLEDWEAKGEYRRTALQWAECGKHWDCVSFIRECVNRVGSQSNQDLSVPEDPDNPDNGASSSAGAALEQSEGSAAGGAVATTGEGSRTDRERYDIGAAGSRLAIVVNIINFDDPGIETRTGAALDTVRDCMPLCLEKLGFEYKLVEDVGEAFFNDIKSLRIFDEEEYNRCSAFLLCIMSHGELGYVLAADGAKVNLERLFGGIRLHESLEGKPKIFMTQACRHIKERRVLEAYPGIFNALRHEDSLYIFSVVEGDKSHRYCSGTPLIQAFKEVVYDEAYSNDNTDEHEFTLLLPRVIDKVVSKTDRKQVACYDSTLLKLLFFPKD